MEPFFNLNLYKEDFKFSAAHFLIFNEREAERLHGHNYRVRFHVRISETLADQNKGFYKDFGYFKKKIRERLEKWDEIVLLPGKHPDMTFEHREKTLEVQFRERFYAFPENEVLRLPVVNTSVEELSRLLAHDFVALFSQGEPVGELTVEVEESPGQSASFTRSF